MITAAGVQAGASALSAVAGIFGRKSKGGGLDLGALRRQAEANGFNPLTVLRMTGGAGFVSQVQPSRLGAISAGLGQFAQAVGDYQRVQMDRDQLDQSNSESKAREGLYRAQTDALQTELSRPAALTTSAKEPVKSVPKTWEDWGYIDVFSGSSQKPMKLHAGIAKRLKIEPGDPVIVEDIEAVGGDIMGEIAGVNLAAEELRRALFGESHTEWLTESLEPRQRSGIFDFSNVSGSSTLQQTGQVLNRAFNPLSTLGDLRDYVRDNAKLTWKP